MLISLFKILDTQNGLRTYLIFYQVNSYPLSTILIFVLNRLNLYNKFNFKILFIYNSCQIAADLTNKLNVKY